MKRRDFLTLSLTAAAGIGTLHASGCSSNKSVAMPMSGRTSADLFGISLAEWSLHRALRAGDLSNLDFPVVTRQVYDIGAVEYVNTFFKDKAQDREYLMELRTRCEGEGVKSLLIMCDQEGSLGDPIEVARTAAVQNHLKWVDAAQELGCHSIRVNAASRGDWNTQRDLASDGLRRLTEYAAERDLNVIVENHGGLSSNGAWLSEVMRTVDHERCGTLPDFGNFQVSPGEWYDRYKGVAELMPFAKAVSAKSFEFDESGNDRRTDFSRMMAVVLDAGYRGHVGIEFEGDEVSEEEGILATRDLLLRIREELSSQYQ